MSQSSQSVDFKSEWPPNVPDSLVDLCLKYCASNLDETICYRENALRGRFVFCLRSFVWFPSSVGDALLKHCGQITHSHLGLFRNPDCVTFKHIDLRSVRTLRDEELEMVMAHNPVELQLSSDYLTQHSMDLLCSQGSNIISLYISASPNMFVIELTNDPDNHEYANKFRVADIEISGKVVSTNPVCPKVRRLAIRELQLPLTDMCSILFNRPIVVHLDLSDCVFNWKDLHAGLQTLPSLQILIMHNVPMRTEINYAIEAICKVKTLRFVIVVILKFSDTDRYLNFGFTQ